MGTSRSITERQLTLAAEELKARTKVLQTKGEGEAVLRVDPVWRKLNARVRQINARLKKISSVEANNAELERLKIERQEQATAKLAEQREAAKSALVKKPPKAAPAAKESKKDGKEDKPAKEGKESKPAKKPAAKKGKSE